MIVVTGANGFIGSALCSALNIRYPESKILPVDHILTNERDLLVGKKILDVIAPERLWEYLDNHKEEIEWIIHLGACASTTEQDWDYLSINNVDYSIQLFEWSRKNSVPLIYASSAATYGDGSLGFVETIDPQKLRPLNLYGESKVLMDRWALMQTNTPPYWYGLRFFNVFGPNEYYKGSMASLAYKAYYQIRESKSLKLFRSYDEGYKDGEQLRDFVYVKDIINWICELMEQKPKSGIYNLGSGTARSWLDVAHSLFKAMDLTPRIEFVDMPDDVRKHYQYFTQANIDKLLKSGLSKPGWSLEEAVSDYVCNYLVEGKRF